MHKIDSKEQSSLFHCGAGLLLERSGMLDLYEVPFFGGWPFELFVQVWSAILLVHQMILPRQKNKNVTCLLAWLQKTLRSWIVGDGHIGGNQQHGSFMWTFPMSPLTVEVASYELGQVLCAEIPRCQHVVAASVSTPIEGLWKTRLSGGNGCLDEIILCLASFSSRSDPLRFRLHQPWLRQQQVHAKWSTVCGLTSALVRRWCQGFYDAGKYLWVEGMTICTLRNTSQS